MAFVLTAVLKERLHPGLKAEISHEWELWSLFLCLPKQSLSRSCEVDVVFETFKYVIQVKKRNCAFVDTICLCVKEEGVSVD